MAIKNGLSGQVPAGAEVYCSHNEKEGSYYNSFGGGYSVMDVKLDVEGLYAQEPCPSPCGDGPNILPIEIHCADPCGGCGHNTVFNYYLPASYTNPDEILEDFPSQWQASSGMGLINVEVVDGVVIRFTSCKGGSMLTVKPLIPAALYSVGEVVDATCPVVPLGMGTCVPVGRVVTQSLSSPYYSPKTAHMPQGGTAPDEVFLGITQENMVHTLKEGHDTCCGCNCYPTCKPMCVKEAGHLKVDLLDGLPVLNAVAGYVNDPTLDTNGMIVAYDPAVGPPAGVEPIPGSSFSHANVGDMSAVINF